MNQTKLLFTVFQTNSPLHKIDAVGKTAEEVLGMP